jgi:hypothetical protein
MNYELEDIQGLMNDLSTVGLSRKSFAFKTHYVFGEDLLGENDGNTPMYITKEGADLLAETKFGTWGKNFFLKWTKSMLGEEKYWTRVPVPSTELIRPDLLRVNLFQSSPRMHFPGSIPSIRVKRAYNSLMGEFQKIRFEGE